MPKYMVIAPITGIATKEVDASSEEEAIKTAFADDTEFSIETWDVHKQVLTGNVFHGELDEVYAKEQPE
jgi:hypothetical protein